ncbi:N(6)-hydroxylysine O-acetyltransferase, partial [Escherichia coli]
QGEVYRRYDPRIRRMLSFRIADPVSDAERFTRWMNDPRVEYFWEQSGSLEVQIAYLERQLTSKHAFPLIGCFDDRPFSYFEIYWAAEDRIGRHYSWQPFDRGLHLLVGEQQWRGAHYVQSWLRGVTHYLLLNEPRTQRTVLEPRIDNQRLFRHLEPAGYRTIKEFDFPHKRSRMVMADRHHFFTEVGL